MNHVATIHQCTTISHRVVVRLGDKEGHLSNPWLNGKYVVNKKVSWLRRGDEFQLATLDSTQKIASVEAFFNLDTRGKNSKRFANFVGYGYGYGGVSAHTASPEKLFPVLMKRGKKLSTVELHSSSHTFAFEQICLCCLLQGKWQKNKRQEDSSKLHASQCGFSVAEVRTLRSMRWIDEHISRWAGKATHEGSGNIEL